MNTRASHSVTLSLLLGGACLMGLGCSTTTPIGAVDESMAGTMGGPNGTGDTPAVVPPGTYVPSADQVSNDPPLTNPSGVSGDWIGYLENYDLYFTGSDALRFHFGVDAAGHDTLTVVRGNGTPPAPPTDANQPWPGSIVNAAGNPGVGVLYPRNPIDGFVYTAHGAAWQGSRLKFGLADAEPWMTWCNLQTSYLVDSRYTCNPGNIFSCVNDVCHFDTQPTMAVDRNHAMMCLRDICVCNATGCGANESPGTMFDITFSGDQARGSMGQYNLMLTRAQP